MESILKSVLHYYFNSPFLMFSTIITGCIISSAARKICRDENIGAGLFYFFTKIGSIIGWLSVIGFSCYFSFTLHWYYFLIGIASILTAYILSGFIVTPLQWLSDKFASNYDAIWVIRSYLYYIVSFILLSVGINGLFHYC